MMIDFNQLWPKYGIEPDGVLHLGANEGQEASVYEKLNVGQVVWIEAIPSVFDKLVENIAEYSGQTCILACVGDEDGKKVKFNISNNQSQSSSYLELAHHTIIHPEVNYVQSIELTMRRIDKIFAPNTFQFGDWFLNADLQGAELDAFKGMGDLLNNFKWVYCEVNKRETYKDCPLIEDIDLYLLKYGFERVETGQWVADTWTDALYIKKYDL